MQHFAECSRQLAAFLPLTTSHPIRAHLVARDSQLGD